jgi:hypothetical protein
MSSTPSGGELASISSQIDELRRRVADLADGAESAKRDDMAGQLRAAERTLRSAARAVDTARSFV